MVQVIVIALFVALHVHDDALVDAHTQPVAPWIVLAALGALWATLQGVAWRSARRMDRHGSVRAAFFAQRVHAVARLLAGAALVGAIVAGGWPEAVRARVGDLIAIDEILIVSPMFAFLLAAWWTIEPVERRLKEAVLWRHLHTGATLYPPMARGLFVWHQMRHSALLVLVPLTLVSAWQETVQVAASRMAGRLPGWAFEAAAWLGVGVVLVVTPAIVRVLWDTVPISAGELRDQAVGVCRRFGVRVRGPLLWRTHGSVANAAVLGVLYPFRYMLFTDALLEGLTREQVEGVVAHEVAHVKLNHMIWLALSLFATTFAAGWALWGLEMLLRPADPRAYDGPLSLGVLALAGLVFGFVSRRFERQADAFGALHLSGDAPVVTPEAGRAMGSALEGVASLNAIPPDRFSFRHGSIGGRIAHVRGLVGLPRGSLPIDRTVRRIKLATGIVIAGTVLAYAAMHLLEHAA
ncbi:MAG: M48 family metallopeptidase [Planctomycetota bacterium]|nr:M48 family metallopeptidase [Planctomycetota bacterium]